MSHLQENETEESKNQFETKFKQTEEMISNLKNVIDDLNNQLASLKQMMEGFDNKIEGTVVGMEQQMEELKEVVLGAPIPSAADILKVESSHRDIASAPPGGLNELERTNSELNHMNSKLKFLTQDTNRQIGELRKKIKILEELLEELERKIEAVRKEGGSKGLSAEVNEMVAKNLVKKLRM